jgi:hypothetical protein
MKKAIICLLVIISSSSLFGKENINQNGRSNGNPNEILSGCNRSLAKTTLEINNVRALIFIQGDMWWDLVGDAEYEIPKGSGKTSLFAGAIWVGGLDAAGNLRVAAQTYRQTGDDFWPGPVDLVATDVSNAVCNKYDKHFKITREEVEQFVSDWASNPSTAIPDVIAKWPGNGDASQNQAPILAPFYDNPGASGSNADGIYNPADGDFPAFYFEKLPTTTSGIGYPSNPGMDPCSKDLLLGDQALWWVFNDVGNIHTETASTNPIGLEIQAQAFAFATNDDINNMTFYRYKIINRNTSVRLDTCYFGAWVDPDLGNYLDDYVGCDVKRGFGYCYNGDEDDEGVSGYGLNPPASGLDFFQGPTADVGDGIDNDRDSCVDCTRLPDGSSIPDSVIPEEIIMAKFVYYDNDFSDHGNPENADDYYGYLKGFWKDGNHITYGGNGYGGGTGATSIPCEFMFPGNPTSDPYGWGTNGVPQANWDEVLAGNNPADRRFLQSAGPFTLQPGAVNYITTGAVWARAVSGGALASRKSLLLADDFAQALFNNCFKILNGPDAPDLTLRENDRQIIITLTNDNPIRNNYRETYGEIDPFTFNLSQYVFEGYEIYQLRDQTVTVGELDNPDRARLIAQFDIKNGIKEISLTNYELNPQTGTCNGYLAATATDNGVKHTIVITDDAFASGASRLVNHKTYYYTAVAIGYNAEEAIDTNLLAACKTKPVLIGRNNVKTYSAIPHILAPELGGLILNSQIGDGPEITRIEGKGNGGDNAVEWKTNDGIHSSNISDLTSPPYIIKHPTYVSGLGPVDVFIYDPFKVKGGDYELWALDTSRNGQWILKELSTGQMDTSHKTLESVYEQIFSNYGFSIDMHQKLNGLGQPFQVGDSTSIGKVEAGFLEANKVNQGDNWLGGVVDVDGPKTGAAPPATYYDWIASGAEVTDYSYSWGSQPTTPVVGPFKDADEIWENLMGRTWAPYRFTRASGTQINYSTSPAFGVSSSQFRDIQERIMPSVDIVFTSNPALWTKCPVIEMEFTPANAVGGATKNRLRKSPSLDKVGNQLVTTTSTDSGFSWFPGYAVDVESGERLNMAFGEDSYIRTDIGFPTNIGADMKWNPDNVDSLEIPGNDDVYHYSFGGRHTVFVFARVDSTIIKVQNPSSTWDTLYMPAYDEGATLASLFRRTGTSVVMNRALREVWATCAWVGYPKMAAGYSHPPIYDGGGNDVRVRIRVSKPYAPFNPMPGSPTVKGGMPYYTFNTTGFVPTKGDLETAKDALDLINVVPNPYYAFSSYEKNQVDNRIKIVNLPPKCVVTIYSTNGTLIRQLRRDVSSFNSGEGTTGGIDFPETNLETALDWDLKNEAGIPVSSGIFLIHIEAKDGETIIGEKVIKFFGIMRPIDLDTF